MYSCVLRIDSILYIIPNLLVFKKHWTVHIENHCILIMFDPPAKSIPILQRQKCQNYLNNINLLKMSLEKKKRWLCFFVFFRNIKSEKKM